MQVYEIYEVLCMHFKEELKVHKSVTLETVSNLLGCSKRNANFALKRLVEKKWISWHPGRGRGKTSAVEFHVPIQSMYVQIAKEKVKNGDMSGSLRFIENYVKDLKEKEKYFQWLYHSFGVHSEENNSMNVDTLRVPMIKEIGSLDPILTTCGIEAHLIKHLFNTLVVYHPEQNRIVPGLAHFWESKNDIEWTLYLRKGVIFHDRSECNSADVLYTFQRLKNEPSIYSWMVEDIARIDAVNNWTIKFQLTKRNPYFLHYLAAHPLSIIQKNSTFQGSTLPIGTGPFKVAQNDENILLLQANSDYYAERPFLDKIELWKTVENSASVNGVRPDVFQLEKLILQHAENKEMKLETRLENGCKLLTFNMNIHGPQQSKLFRRGMQILLQREELIKQIDWEVYYPAYSMLPGKSAIKESNSDYKSIAKKYITESGYSGEPIHLYCSIYHEKDALLLQRLCQEIGIHLAVRFIQKKNDAPYPKTADAQMILFECLIDHDTTFSLLDVYMTKESYIRRHLSPDIVSAVENKINSHLHSANKERNLREILDEIEQDLIEEDALIFLYRRKKTIQYSVGLAGIQIEPLGWVNFTKIWCLG